MDRLGTPHTNDINDLFNKDIPGVEMQMVYKIASLESTVNGGLRRLDEKFDRLLHDMAEHRNQATREIAEVKVETTKEFVKLETRIKEHETRVDALTKWRDNFNARTGVILSMCFGAWALFGDTFKEIIGRIL